MTVQEALNLYHIPYQIVSTANAGGFVTYQLSALGAQATVAKLQARLTDLNNATGAKLEILIDENGLSLRSRQGTRTYYDWYNYAGHLDFSNPEIPFIVGFTPQGGLVTDTMKHCPHLLVSGTTGSGKTVFLHSLVRTILSNNAWLYLVDCKQEEFCIYEKCASVAYSALGEYSAGLFLNDLIREMDERNESKRKEGFRDFESWQAVNPRERRRCVLVIDELADLLSDKRSKQALLPRILRIAQKGRSAGIHLVLATQRPDATVINGTIKANIPSRLAFHAITNTDSRVVLDRGGAELLSGNGDGLYLSNGSQQIQRIQAPYIDTNEIKKDILSWNIA